MGHFTRQEDKATGMLIEIKGNMEEVVEKRKFYVPAMIMWPVVKTRL